MHIYICRSIIFKSPVSTNSTTRAGCLLREGKFATGRKMEARVGIEPAYTELQSAA